MATKSVSFVAAQAKAMRFWSLNRDNDTLTRVVFLVDDGRGNARHLAFARDVDDYVVADEG